MTTTKVLGGGDAALRRLGPLSHRRSGPIPPFQSFPESPVENANPAKHANYSQSANIFPPARRFHALPGGEGRGGRKSNQFITREQVRKEQEAFSAAPTRNLKPRNWKLSCQPTTAKNQGKSRLIKPNQ
jgi:hypothetical protein